MNYSESLSVLVGEWEIEATHPMSPGTVVRGTATFEWLSGEKFLIYRSENDHPQFPDSISVIGAPEGSLRMYYFDTRGVHRIYEVAIDGNEWKMSRDEPQFSQRFTGTFSSDGTSISGLWKLSRDDKTYADDLAINFQRAQ